MLHVIIRMIFRIQAHNQMEFTHFNIDSQRLAFLNWSPLSGLYPDKQISLSKTRLATSSTENIGSQIQVPTWWRHSALAKKPPICVTQTPLDCLISRTRLEPDSSEKNGSEIPVLAWWRHSAVGGNPWSALCRCTWAVSFSTLEFPH